MQAEPLSNPMIQRVAEFLAQHPPFTFLEAGQVHKLAAGASIRVAAKDELVFRQGEGPAPRIYFIYKGGIQLIEESGGVKNLIDMVGEGQLFGLRSFLSEQPYVFSALASEECIIYALDGAVFREIMSGSPQLALFFAAGLAKSHPIPQTLGFENDALLGKDLSHCVKSVATAPPECSVWEAAAMMAEKQIGSLVVAREDGMPLGIATDKDMTKLAARRGSYDLPLREIMSAPVQTVSSRTSQWDAQWLMAERNIRHLVITADGTPRTAVCGIVSERDLLVENKDHPLSLSRQMQKTADPGKFRRLRDRAEAMISGQIARQTPFDNIRRLARHFNDLSIRWAIGQAWRETLEEGGAAPAKEACWVSMGSEAREEQWLRTDQDNALILPEGAGEADRDFFAAFAEKTTRLLAEAGYQYCPADMMASNPAWRADLAGWTDYFDKWILAPTPDHVMRTTIFFDMRAVWGDGRLLAQLRSHIAETLRRADLFMTLLADNALHNPPPLGFFRKLILESDGAHKDSFDIKARCLMPIVDAARVLCLHAQHSGPVATLDRLAFLAEKEEKNRETYRHAAEAFQVFMRFRAQAAVRQGDNGRYLQLALLSPLEMALLKNAFASIRDLQTIVKVRFQTDYIHG